MYNELDKIAKKESDTFKTSLQYLIDQQNAQRAADEQTASLRYQQLVDEINAQRDPLQQQYGLDTQGAYVNKMLAGQNLEEKLSRLGLNTQGFGVSQQMDVDSAYGQNLNALMLQRNQGLRDIDRQLTGAHGEKLARASELESLYAGRLSELNRYITESAETKYQNVYNQLAQARAYEDQLKQQELENAFREKQLKSSYSSGGGGSYTSGLGDTFSNSTTTFDFDASLNPKGANTKSTNDALAKYGAFDNGYQPRGIIGYGLVKSAGAKVKDVLPDLKAKGGYSLANHTIWVTPDGLLWYWDGSAGQYLRVPAAAAKKVSAGGQGSFGGGSGGGGFR